MPGWILVANRFSFLTALGANGGVLRAVASLVCLVVLTGCSNIRQQSLELPLPILPSQAAVDSKVIAAPVLPAGESDVVAGSPVETGAVLGSAAFENDFTASDFAQASSVQSFLSSENDFQPPELQARIVGAFDKAEVTAVKLKAVSRKSAPAPAIETVLGGSNLGNGETTDVCGVTGAAECACCKEKVLPKLAVVEPIDPEQLPGLFGTDQQRADSGNFVPVQAMLQPLRSKINEPAAKVTAQAVVSKEIVNSPIRLTAMPNRQRLRAQLPSSATVVADQPQNKAKQLIQIMPDAFRDFKAEVDRPSAELAKTFKSSPMIKVSPVMDLNSVAVEGSPAAAVAPANEVVEAFEVESRARSIPVSPSGIRVSAAPFNALASSFPKPASVKAAPVVTPLRAQPAVRAEPAVRVHPPVPTRPRVSHPPVPKSSAAEVFVGGAMSRSNDFVGRQVVPTKVRPFPVAGTDQRAVSAVTEEVYDFEERARPMMSPGIDPLADLHGLPDMDEIERQLEDFGKEQEFDPLTVNPADRVDPALLKEKLDGPPKKITAPVAKVVATAPDEDLITQQLAAQSSALLAIQNEIKQLKPEPVLVVDEDSDLTLANAAFCSKISGFGQFTSFVTNTFSGSQNTLLYCEVENQKSKRFTSVDGSQQFETVLHGSITIYDGSDRVVQTVKFPAIKDIARTQRRDFYVYFPVQFNELASGDYRLELSVEDVVGNEAAVLRPSMRFSVR